MRAARITRPDEELGGDADLAGISHDAPSRTLTLGARLVDPLMRAAADEAAVVSMTLTISRRAPSRAASSMARSVASLEEADVRSVASRTVRMGRAGVGAGQRP